VRGDVRIGEIRASGIGRRFKLSTAGPRSLKETLLGKNISTTRDLWALRNIEFHIQPGESFGVVGQNGSGKSTLLKLLAGIFAPTEGALAIGGRVGSLLEVGAGFHPEFTGVENVHLNGAIFGMSRAYLNEHMDEIIGFAELEEFAHMPVKTYSSGMFTRLGFAVAMHIQPDILLLDEVLSVGDEAFQRKSQGKIWEFKRAGGTLVFVSHDAGSVERLCERSMLLDHGHAVVIGESTEVLREYHRRLAGHAPAATAAPAAIAGGDVRLTAIRVLGEDATPRDRFLEAETILLDLEFVADAAQDGAMLAVGLRDAADVPLASEVLPSLAFEPGTPLTVRLELPSPPLASGEFAFDVQLTSHDGDRLLVDAERAARFSVYPTESGPSGLLRLGGVFRVLGGDVSRVSD
jgi:ABC-type polysaccharide/polyol phosphate transport system ATPase subunit